MIASLRGKLIQLEMDHLVLDVAGVGYEIHIPFPLHLECKDKMQAEIFLHIFHSITDRGERLFGFSTRKDRELFQLIKSLHGIGELTALKILSFFHADDLYKIAKEDDRKTLEKIPKVKGKTSEKILFEIKQNLKKLEMFLNDESTKTDSEDRESDLATLALIQLGFDEKTATKQVTDARKLNPNYTASEIVKQVITGTR